VQDKTVGAWMEDPRAAAFLDDALALGRARAGSTADVDAARARVAEEMALLATMPAKGRTAADRTRRAARSAATLGVRMRAFDAAQLPGFDGGRG
jgi:hypothetical protein